MSQNLDLVSSGNATVSNAPQGVSPEKSIEEIMYQLLQKAIGAVPLLDRDAAKQATIIARAMFEQGKSSLPEDTLFTVGLAKDLICLFEPLICALVLQTEGRFTEAIEGVERALSLNDQVIATVNEFGRSSKERQEVVAEIEPVLRPFAIVFRGIEAYIRADLVGYQGRVSEYLDLLRYAVSELRRVNDLPQSANPAFLLLAGMCNTMADRLQTRSKFFELRSDVAQYSQPKGEKIFIIHGRAEGKWRELRDLLQDRYNQDVMVLEDEVDAGSTLIDKFINYADKCCYAFALLTPDDFAKSGKIAVFQARPNALFELGWFYGRFGPDRVSIVKQRGTAIPSDLDGILSMDFNDKVSECLIKIENELQRIGRLTRAKPARKPRGRKLTASPGSK